MFQLTERQEGERIVGRAPRSKQNGFCLHDSSDRMSM